MCPYDRCSKTLGRARTAPKRKPMAVRSSSATRQRRPFVPDVAAGEAPPVSLPPAREAILRSTEIGVVVLELLPHLRQRIEIRDPGDPDARLPRHDPRHPPFPAQRPPASIRTSLPVEGRLALLQDGAEAFLRIGHREEAILQFPLEREAFVHRHLDAFRD